MVNPALPVAVGASDPHEEMAALARVLDTARFQVLRWTLGIGLLIACANLLSASVGFTASGDDVRGPAVELAAAWCGLWALAMALPRRAARCFVHWKVTAAVLVIANAGTAAVTNGMDSPVLSVCIYAGWVTSVVASARAAIVMSVGVAGLLVVGYLLAGASLFDVVTGPNSYNAVSNVILPLIAGAVGVLLAAVANTVFGGLGEHMRGLRHGEPATTPGMTALLARSPVLLTLPPARAHVTCASHAQSALTPAEREVVALLAQGHRPKQIALLRGVALSTIRSQIQAAKRKTGSRTIDQLVAIAWDGDR